MRKQHGDEDPTVEGDRVRARRDPCRRPAGRLLRRLRCRSGSRQPDHGVVAGEPAAADGRDAEGGQPVREGDRRKGRSRRRRRGPAAAADHVRSRRRKASGCDRRRADGPGLADVRQRTAQHRSCGQDRQGPAPGYVQQQRAVAHRGSRHPPRRPLRRLAPARRLPQGPVRQGRTQGARQLRKRAESSSRPRQQRPVRRLPRHRSRRTSSPSRASRTWRWRTTASSWTDRANQPSTHRPATRPSPPTTTWHANMERQEPRAWTPPAPPTSPASPP